MNGFMVYAILTKFGVYSWYEIFCQKIRTIFKHFSLPPFPRFVTL